MRRFVPLLGCLSLVAAFGPARAGEASDRAAAGLEQALLLEEAFIALADKAANGVVTLRVIGSHTTGRGPRGHDDSFRELRPDLHPFKGMGSGALVDELGTIYTNAHVVSGADSIEVIFRDGRRGKADVVGFDRGSDVAVLRLLDPPDDLQPLPLGDSDAVRVGQFAVAIGAPLELEGSFTVGHVSALHRNQVGQQMPGIAADGFEDLHYQDFMQVDTPINPGNSGGPLFDVRGRVIGINTAIYAGGGGGIGFSIPINMVRRVAGELIAHGKVRRGWLGVEMSPLDPDLMDLYGIDVQSRVIINRVAPGSPAEASRFRERDIVLEFAGSPVRSVNDLTNAIANAPIGEEVVALVFRSDAKKNGGEQVKLKVVLVEQPPKEERGETSVEVADGAVSEANEGATSEAASARSKGAGGEDRALYEGFGVAFSTEAGGKRDPLGATVSRVRSGSRAEEAGLVAGDIVTQVGEVPVTDAAGAVAQLQSSDRPFIPLKYRRGKATRVTAIERGRE